MSTVNSPTESLQTVVELPKGPDRSFRLYKLVKVYNALIARLQTAVQVMPGDVLACTDLEDRLARIYAMALRRGGRQ